MNTIRDNVQLCTSINKLQRLPLPFHSFIIIIWMLFVWYSIMYYCLYSRFRRWNCYFWWKVFGIGIMYFIKLEPCNFYVVFFLYLFSSLIQCFSC